MKFGRVVFPGQGERAQSAVTDEGCGERPSGSCCPNPDAVADWQFSLGLIGGWCVRKEWGGGGGNGRENSFRLQRPVPVGLPPAAAEVLSAAPEQPTTPAKHDRFGQPHLALFSRQETGNIK